MRQFSNGTLNTMLIGEVMHDTGGQEHLGPTREPDPGDHEAPWTIGIDKLGIRRNGAHRPDVLECLGLVDFIEE